TDDLSRRGSDLREVDRASEAVEQRGAEEEERRGVGTEQQVLERGLLAQQSATPRETREDVQREREHLERDEEGEQVSGCDEQQHAAETEERERVDLGLLEALAPGELFVVRTRNRGRGGREGVLALRGAVGEDRDREDRQDEERALQRER